MRVPELETGPGQLPGPEAFVFYGETVAGDRDDQPAPL